MNKYTPGPWSQGRLLMTPVTSKWTESQRRGADEEERHMVFANFKPEDDGRSRQFVAMCANEEDARLISAAPDLLFCLQVICEHAGEDFDRLDGMLHLTEAKKAIAKATGQNHIKP